MPYLYPLTSDDIRSPFEAMVQSLANRFGVRAETLRSRNELATTEAWEPWKPGDLLDIPFSSDPDSNIEYDDYDLLEQAGKDYAAGQFAGLDWLSRHKVAGFRWVPGSHSAQQLWLHWGNRHFRAWQLAHGGNIDRIRTGGGADVSPPLRLPHPKPTVAQPLRVAIQPCGANHTGIETDATRAFRRYLDEVAEDLRLLRIQVDTYASASKEAAGIFAAGRAVSDIVDYLYEQTAWEYKDGFERTQKKGQLAALKLQANEVYRQLREKMPPDAPAAHLAPEVRAELERRRRNIKYKLTNEHFAKLVDALDNDPLLGKCRVHALLQAAGPLLADAADEAANAGETSLAEVLESALTDPGRPDNVLGRVLAVLGTITAAFGNLPGPEAFTVTMLKTLGVLMIPTVANNAAAASSWSAKLSGLYFKVLGFKGSQQAKFERLATSVINESKEGGNYARAMLDRKDAKLMLEEMATALQSGKFLTTALAVLTIAQLVVAVGSIRDLDDLTIADVVNLGGSLVASGTAAVAAVGTLVLNPLKLKAQLTFLSRIGGAAFAIQSLVGGAVTLFDGFANVDGIKMAVGGLQVASGIAFVAAMARVMPGGQTASVVLNFIALGISLVDSAVEGSKSNVHKTLQGLVKALKETKSRWSLVVQPIVKTIGMETSVKSLDDALDGTSSGALIQLRPKPWTHPTEVARNQQALVEYIKALGFGERSAASLISMSAYAGP